MDGIVLSGLGKWPFGSRLQPRIQPLELCQVSGTLASRGEGQDCNEQHLVQTHIKNLLQMIS